jgi:AGCS family alanine or glycine:cation symporter
MWLTALIGGASAFVESTLAQIYKRRKADGGSYGGPSCYIETVCKSKFLAVVFALALIFTYGVGYNMLASYNLQSSFAAFDFYKPYHCWIFGAVTAGLFLFTIMGGSKRLVKTTGTLVPFMGLFVALKLRSELLAAAKERNISVKIPTVVLVLTSLILPILPLNIIALAILQGAANKIYRSEG